MTKKVRALLIALGVIATVVLPGGFLIPAVYALIVASRRKAQLAAPTQEQ